MLPVQEEGPVTDQVTLVEKVPVPVTVAVNCCSVVGFRRHHKTV